MFAPSVSSPCARRFVSRRGLTASGNAGLASAELSWPGQRGAGSQTSVRRGRWWWWPGGAGCSQAEEGWLLRAPAARPGSELIQDLGACTPGGSRDAIPACEPAGKRLGLKGFDVSVRVWRGLRVSPL